MWFFGFRKCDFAPSVSNSLNSILALVIPSEADSNDGEYVCRHLKGFQASGSNFREKMVYGFIMAKQRQDTQSSRLEMSSRRHTCWIRCATTRSLNSQHFISFHLIRYPILKGIWRWSNGIHSAHLQLSRRSPTWIWRCFRCEVFQITFFNLRHSGVWYHFIMLVFTISALRTSWSRSVVNYGPQRSSLFTITEPVKQ